MKSNTQYSASCLLVYLIILFSKQQSKVQCNLWKATYRCALTSHTTGRWRCTLKTKQLFAHINRQSSARLVKCTKFSRALHTKAAAHQKPWSLFICCYAVYSLRSPQYCIYLCISCNPWFYIWQSRLFVFIFCFLCWYLSSNNLAFSETTIWWIKRGK